MKFKILFFIAVLFIQPILTSKESYSRSCRSISCGSGCCRPLIKDCQNFCLCASNSETGTPTKFETTMGHVTDEFNKHRTWMIDFFFLDNTPNNPAGLSYAFKLMTTQLVTNSMQQVQAIGMFFDAKHQLESQRIFQLSKARTHRRYQPSTTFCEFSTMSQSLSVASRNADFTTLAIAKRAANRQVFTGDGVGVRAATSDRFSRLTSYIKDFCDPNDNLANLDYLCKNKTAINTLHNRDIKFTDTIKDKWTMDFDLANDPTVSPDEQALFALNDNLFAHDLFPFISQSKFVDEEGNPAYNRGAKAYMDSRAIIAKRSVAVNSLAAIAALKTKSNAQSQPFIYALMKEMGGDETTLQHIQEKIGENPSYYAQMKVLSKLFFQRPEFFADLYDTPENVKRLNTSIQATTLMRKRDLYRSYLRSEMILAIMLETALEPEIDLIANEINPGN